MRILVCGGRDFVDRALMERVLATFDWDTDLAHGAARGADSMADQYGRHRKWKIWAYPADWKAHGKQAGILRNARMLAEFKPELVIAFPGGTGTADMVKRSRRAGVEVREVET